MSGLPSRPSTLVEAMYRREIWPWALLGATIGLVESGTVAVLVKKGYAGTVDPSLVNFAVAFASGAASLANITSFAWANFAHGRARVGVLTGLMLAFAVMVGLIALVPLGGMGLVVTIVLVLLARLLWAGVTTVRAVVWSANYPRSVMARMTSRFVMVASLASAGIAMVAGAMLDQFGSGARWLYALAAACGVLAAMRFRAVRVRREFRLLAAEQSVGGAERPFSLRILREVLERDPEFRRYMFWMSLYGGGNLMVSAQLVVLYTDRLQLTGITQMLLLTVIPLVLMPLFLPWWVRLFDDGHVIEYRSRQCWALVLAIGMLAVGVWSRQTWLLWLGAVVSSAAYAGANLGWNLGHNDFASLGETQRYMGVHVTLTGVRGLLAPPLGMAFYEGLEWLRPGWGAAALVMPLVLVTAGGLGFVRMRRARDAAARSS